jgi:YVTN family beta-propeller protein
VVDLGASLWQLVVAPDGQYIYVTDRYSDQVRVIDQATLNQVTAVGVGDDPWGIDITGDGSKLVVTCEDSHEVWIIDTSDWSTTIIPLDITADPRDVDILDQSQLAFVTGGSVGTTVHPVYVIDLTDDTLLTSFEGPGQNTNVIAVQPQMHDTGTSVADGQLPAGSVNLVAYPNPFNPSTRITFTLGEDAAGELAVYDLAGRRVRLLAQGSWSAGAHVYHWDGRDDSGRRIGSGVYAVRLLAGEQRHGLKVVLTQ